MSMGRHIWWALLCCAMCFDLKAQDPHFSQYYMHTSHLNPALSGVFQGSNRFSLGYREQSESLRSGSPFRTIKATAELKYNSFGGDFWSINVRLFNDAVRLANFNQSSIHIGGSYIKKLVESNQMTQYVVVGAQIGGGQNSVNWQKLWFGRQFDLTREIVDTGLDSGEGGSLLGNTGNSGVYMDMNAGVLWYAVFPSDASVYIGGAMHHINEPEIGLIPATNATDGRSLFRKITFHAGGEIPLESGLSLLPSAAFWTQGPFSQLNTGINFRYARFNEDDIALRLGLWGRYVTTSVGSGFDSYIAAAGLEYGNYTFAVSYDFTAGDLGRFNGRSGGVELSFIYTNTNQYRSDRLVCPKF